jgi:hypothetical protein
VTTRDKVKTEIDNLDEEDLEIVHRIIVAFDVSTGDRGTKNWRDFVASTYGSFADAPIERADQSDIEPRDLLR